ncbi:MAG TPA: hypothetical protein DCX54_13380 [Flavobacteriales bacterium]|nr:hypothetical protein [Flavobacteriales bacterium]
MSNEKSKIAFIVNPISGKGKALHMVPLIEKAFGFSHDLRINITKGVGDGSVMAGQAIKEGFQIVIAVGGDGTVNEVGTALVGTDAILGIIPVGSGNGLARHLKIPLNPSKAIEVLKAFHVTRIDTGYMNDRVFLNAAGVGLDAEVSRIFSTSATRGWMRYVKIVMRLSIKQREFDARLHLNENSEDVRITMLTVANSAQYGNNAKIAPMADICDGKLDICTLVNMNFTRSFSFLTALMTGKLVSGTHYVCVQSDRLEFESTEEWAHVDGEPVKIDGSLIFTSNPRSLNVIC